MKLPRVKRLNKSSIKESLDNLPSGICFFDKNGLVTLCNRQMCCLAFVLTGRDLQYQEELDDALKKLSEESIVTRNKNIFLLPDGTAWRFAKEAIVDRYGNEYTQYIAFDVTELRTKQIDLEEDNEKLNEAARQLRRLSANVLTVTREKEILSMKMRVHDEIGRSLIAVHQVLIQNQSIDNAEPIVAAWQRAISLQKHSNEDPTEDDMLNELIKACTCMGIDIIVTGRLPTNKDAAYLLLTAVRECATNAVRYASANKLYVSIQSDVVTETVSAIITNNGVTPKGEIVEGGGLSSLRRNIERLGGSILIKHFPVFQLTATVYVRKEELS